MCQWSVFLSRESPYSWEAPGAQTSRFRVRIAVGMISYLLFGYELESPIMDSSIIPQ